jgi:Tetratricopeptide repeat
LGALLAMSVAMTAAADPASDSFQLGRKAFENGEYAAALAAFEAAAAAGMSGPAVHFNIGVAAWRAGNLTRAEAAFREVARSPEMAALAHYNLGLVALKRADAAQARRWFTATQRETEDERLLQLAARQLAQLPPPETPNWVGYAVAAAGYDDNVALISSATVSEVSDLSDSFLEAQLAFSAPLDRDWQFDASAFAINYQDLDAFDQWGVQGGARYRFALGDWTNDVGALLAYSTIDGEGLENARVAMFESHRTLTAALQFRARYRYHDIDGLNDFTGLTGHRHEVAAQLDWRNTDWELGMQLQADSGEYRDETLSASRYQITLDAQRALPAGWTASAELRHRHSRYDDDSSGTEDFNEIALMVRKTLSSRWRIFVRYAHADNDATLPEFQYHRGRIAAGIDAVL